MILASPVALALALCACERVDERYAALDLPAPSPVALGPATAMEKLPKITDGVTPGKKQEEEGCGRGHAFDPDGTCVLLATRETPFMQRVQIPAGTFVMGALPGDYDGTLAREVGAVRWSGQPPRHATLPGFWIDLHEVTREGYAACVAAKKCTPAVCPPGPADPAAEVATEVANALPQTCVTQMQAAEYCGYAGGRLPSEAQWEYAARGVDARVYPWGNDIEDTIPQAIYPAGHVREDSSYFGILGLGSNVYEWVADVYDMDAGLRPFLRGEFRDANGPAMTARLGFERKLVCGPEPEADCEGPKAAPVRHVLKHYSVGQRTAGRDEIPLHHPGFELEGWLTSGVGPKVGFRCAADLAPEDVPLRVPGAAAQVPLLRAENGFQIFGAVAEAVTQEEARRYCAALQVPDLAGNLVGGWRLPAAMELPIIAASFRGPGPFWAEDGAVVQSSEKKPMPADTPWTVEVVAPETALLARCVRSGA